VELLSALSYQNSSHTGW